jgi:S-adenosylmethionine-diacylglycerol 3-amino-3-carboxypropyl transferase
LLDPAQRGDARSAGPSPIRRRVLVGAEPAEADGNQAAPMAWDRGSILFSACNEDSRCELRAFGSVADARVLCVTAGGGRVLNLLVGRPKSIVAVDLNPAQNALLELKLAAMRRLDHGDFLGFLGVRAAADRVTTYERLRPGLSSTATGFFDAQVGMVRRGVLFEGKLERFFSRLSRVLHALQPRGLGRLFSFDDIEEQRRFLSSFETPLWRALAPNAARRWVMKTFSGDPGFYRYVPEHVPLHREIYEGIHRYFHNHLARDNALMQVVFFGRYIHEAALPAYLNAKSFDRVKAALESVRIETVVATVDDVTGDAGPEAFDAFSLSDISSYLDDDAHARLFAGVVRAAAPGARLCSRSNIHHRPPAAAEAARIRRDPGLEAQLAIDDHSCVHKFVVGEIT